MSQAHEVIPHNIQAEQYLLGTILSSTAIALVADRLTPEDFYQDRHRIIYEAVLVLYQRNETIDAITVSDLLQPKQVVIDNEVGGLSYMMKLVNRTFHDHLSAIDHVEEYANIIVDKALARRGMMACGTSAQLFATEPAQSALAKTEAMFAEIGRAQSHEDFISLSSVLEEGLDRLSAIQRRGGVLLGIPTGFHDLDMLTGGLQNEKLIVIAGRPGMGKTSFALSLAYHAGQVGRKVGILSLEMSKEELSDRLIAIDGRLDSRRVSSGQLDDDEWERVTTSSARLAALPIAINDAFGCSVMALRSKAKRFSALHGLDMLVVDYLQLMDADGEGSENEVKVLSIISRNLKGLARELCIPVVALAQLSRKVEERQVKVPQLSDLRGSGSIEQDADIVMFLYREEEYNQNTERRGQADIIVAKHRGGPKGTVVVGFDETQTRFYNFIDDEEAQRYR